MVSLASKLVVLLAFVAAASALPVYEWEKMPDAPIDPFSFDLFIIGGVESTPYSRPWITAIVSPGSGSAYNRQFCGGSLIDPNWVLTAAHCCSSGASGYELHIARHDLSAASEAGQEVRRVTRVVKHPNYNSRTLANDACLLQLDSAARTKPVVMIQPTQSSLEAPGTLGTVAGWGNTKSSGVPSYPPRLREVNVPVVSYTQCTATGAYGSSQITADMLCAGYKEGGKDSCQGDSGGPYFVKSGTSDVLVGVVSWGEGCAQPNKYGVYSRVVSAYNWIRSTIGGEIDAQPEEFN